MIEARSMCSIKETKHPPVVKPLKMTCDEPRSIPGFHFRFPIEEVHGSSSSGAPAVARQTGR